MKYILTPNEMQAVDRSAIEDYGIPSVVLMENAARSAAWHIKQFISESDACLHGKIRVLCGAGNNGGDGFAIARHLHEDYGDRVQVIFAREKKTPSRDCAINFEIIQRIGIECRIIDSAESDIATLNFESSDIIIEALLGAGGRGKLQGAILALLNKVKNTGAAAIIAIDNPAGLNCMNGAAEPETLRADLTIAMAAEKTGLLLGDAPDICGGLATAFIGAPQSLIRRHASAARLVNGDNSLSNLLRRKRISSKFDYGRVVVVAGSRTMPGAAALAANAAITAGAGLVELITPELHAAILPEIIRRETLAAKRGYFTVGDIADIMDSLDKADAIVIGPGLGLRPETREFIVGVANICGVKPIVLDADAIAVTDKLELRDNMILTPHIGEFSRISGLPRQDIAQSPLDTAKDFAAESGALLHLKHVPSITTDGKFAFFTTIGNPCMATAGSGDVLSGVIGAFAARSSLQSSEGGGRASALLFAAACGAYIHALSGDLCAKPAGFGAITASRIVEALPLALSEALV